MNAEKSENELPKCFPFNSLALSSFAKEKQFQFMMWETCHTDKPLRGLSWLNIWPWPVCLVRSASENLEEVLRLAPAAAVCEP